MWYIPSFESGEMQSDKLDFRFEGVLSKFPLIKHVHTWNFNGSFVCSLRNSLAPGERAILLIKSLWNQHAFGHINILSTLLKSFSEKLLWALVRAASLNVCTSRTNGNEYHAKSTQIKMHFPTVHYLVSFHLHPVDSYDSPTIPSTHAELM